jgi:hypothetical protein
MNDKFVVKDNGSQEAFDEEKIKRSLIKSGAGVNTVNSAIENVKKNMKDYMPSRNIYKHIIRHLKNREPDTAIKYKLKWAIMDLGPTGYIFEKYFAKILAEYGFETEVSTIVRGLCVDHEVDIIARKNDEYHMVECKYHNDLEMSSDIKTALYVHSRFEDIRKAYNSGLNGYNLREGWLATNTKVTNEAIKYSKCVKMKVVAWHYPEEENLEYFIETKKLYPVSILNGLNNQQKNSLFGSDIITIKDFLKFDRDQLLNLLNTSPDHLGKLLSQIEMLI